MPHGHKTLLKWKLVTGVSILAMASPTLLAESINPPTTPQIASMNASESQNLDMVLNWWREVLRARHAELAEKYQAEDYIQHDPNVPTGRAAFVKFFSSFGPPINPIPATLSPAPVVKGAKGDFVWLIFEHQAKTHRFNSFEIIRIQNGKVQEHWDSEKKRPGTPAFIPSSAAPPSKWPAGKLSKEERHNSKLAAEAFKDMLQYAHPELADKIVDRDYIQHNPNVPQGRDGLKQAMSQIAQAPEAIKPEWKDAPALTLASGPFVVMMWHRKEKDPSDPNKEYIWNHYDAIRIENGLIKEHWDEENLASR
ncbi:MAG TPA: ester cyclase [Bryobacteraceae bacterium]|nr:ester cyclase [Bryobacteraceae bacterium]